jgi:hypothetical protein
VVAVLVVCGALASVANAATRSQQFTAAGGFGADLAVGDDGRAFLVTLGVQRDRGRSVSVRVRSAAAGAGFGAALRLGRFGALRRDVRAGIAGDGSGVIAVRAVRRTHRRVEVLRFDARGRVGRAVTVSRGNAADLAALAVAPSGAAVVVWFRHGHGRRWRLEAATRDSGRAAFGQATPVSGFVRRPCCTSVSAAIGDGGDAVVTWTSTSRPAVWAALRSPGPGRSFRRPQMLSGEASDAPRAAVGAGGAAAVLYSVQHVPARPGDGLQLHRAVRGGAFGPPEQVNPGGGVTIGDATVTPGGRVLVAWIDRPRATVHVSEAAPGGPLVDAGALGTNAASERVAVAAGDDGAAAVAWTQLVSTEPALRERAVAALRPGRGAPFGRAVALGRPWRAAQPEAARLLPHGGALVVWRGDRFTGPARRRTALAVTRLP